MECHIIKQVGINILFEFDDARTYNNVDLDLGLSHRRWEPS